MADLKGLDEKALIAVVRKEGEQAIKNATQDITQQMNAALEGIQVAARALADLPQSSNDLLAKAHSVLVAEYDRNQLMMKDWSNNQESPSGYPSVNFLNGNQLRGSVIDNPAKRYRVFVIFPGRYTSLTWDRARASRSPSPRNPSRRRAVAVLVCALLTSSRNPTAAALCRCAAATTARTPRRRPPPPTIRRRA